MLPNVNSVDVRAQLVDALRLDLVGPGEVLGPTNRVLGDLDEILPQRPSTWYLAGFLVPLDAAPEQRIDEQSMDVVDVINDSHAQDDAVTPEPAAAPVPRPSAGAPRPVTAPKAVRSGVRFPTHA